MNYSQTLCAPSRKKAASDTGQGASALDQLVEAAANGGTGVDLGTMSRDERRRYMFSR